MKNMMKILGLVGLMTLASCGSDTMNKEDLGSCINGNLEMCDKLAAPPAPPAPAPVVDNSLDLTYDRLSTGVESINYKGLKLRLLNHGNGWRTFAHDSVIQEGHWYTRNLRRMVVFCKNGMLLEYYQIKYLAEGDWAYDHNHQELDYMINLSSHIGNWGDTIETADADLPTFEVNGQTIETSELEIMTFNFTEDFTNGIE